MKSMRNQKSYKSLWWLVPLAWINSLFAAIWSQHEYGQYVLTREQIDHEVSLAPIPVTISIVVVGFLVVPIIVLFIKFLWRHSKDNAPGKIFTFGSSLFWFVLAVPSEVLLLFGTHIGGQYWAGLFRPDWISYGWLATTIEIAMVMASTKVLKIISKDYAAKFTN